MPELVGFNLVINSLESREPLETHDEKEIKNEEEMEDEGELITFKK